MSQATKQLRFWNRWRSQFNPLRGLTIQRAVSLLDDAERGAYAEPQWLYRFVEKRYATLKALKRRRLSAIGKLDWNIKTCAEDELPPGATKAMAEAQAKYLRERYDAIDNLNQAVQFLALAEFRGFSHLEKQVVRGTGGSPVSPSLPSQINHLEPVEQWFWVRDGLYGAWQYNGKAATGVIRGDDVALDNFILREIDDPLDELGLLAFVRANLSEKDWDAFIEIYGIPGRVVIGPPNVPAGKENEYRDAAEKIADGQSGYLPNGSEVEHDNAIRGIQPFKERLDQLDEKLVLAGTGGKLTMLSDATGIGQGASQQHADVFADIAINEAQDISQNCFQKQFDLPALAEKFPGQPVLAYFELAAIEETDVGEIVTEAKDLSQAGYQIDADELSEKTGYKLTLKSDSGTGVPPVYGPGGTGGPPVALKNRLLKFVRSIFNRDQSAQADQIDQELLDNSIDQAARALSSDLSPVRRRLQTIRQIDDLEQKLNALQQFRRDLPSMLPRDPQLAAAYEQSITAAIFNGIAEGAAQRKSQ